MKDVLGLILLAITLGHQRSSGLSLDFASFDSTIRFNGPVDTFEFPGIQSISQFRFTASDGVGDGVVKGGRFDGLFSIGSVVVEGTRQYAPVSGAGTLRLDDAAGSYLTGNLVWDRIVTDAVATTTRLVGYLNPRGGVNLTDIRYSGSLRDFAALAEAGSAQLVLSFEFGPGQSVTDLIDDRRVNSASFSGAIIAVPEPGTWTLLGLGLTSLGWVAWRGRVHRCPEPRRCEV